MVRSVPLVCLAALVLCQVLSQALWALAWVPECVLLALQLEQAKAPDLLLKQSAQPVVMVLQRWRQHQQQSQPQPTQL